MASPAVNHMHTYASAALRTYYAPPNHTAPYRTARGLWVPGPAHGIAESRGGRPSNQTHKLYSPFPDMPPPRVSGTGGANLWRAQVNYPLRNVRLLTFAISYAEYHNY